MLAKSVPEELSRPSGSSSRQKSIVTRRVILFVGDDEIVRGLN